MTLRRCTRSVDGTIPVPALLYNDEELLSSQDGVGIYDGQQKSPKHQAGMVYVTTHRLFYISDEREHTRSFAMDLSHVIRTDYYAGLFKSSAKATLYVSPQAVATSGDPGANDDSESPFGSWECQVCAYRNPPGLSPAAARICGLCGVSRDSVPNPISPPSPHLSSSLPSSSSMPTLVPSSGGHQRRPSTIACPACTFLNHPSLLSCEMCSTELPRLPGQLSMKSAPTSRPASPDSSDDDADATSSGLIKISFRKGGDKAFYAVLRRSLLAKAWLANGSGNNATPGPADPSVADANRSGITGILRNVENSAQGRQIDMTDAFQDLEQLRIKAKDMVRLAADLNERLTASSTTTTATASSFSADALVPSTEPEEATFIRSSLSQLGLEMSDAPVTLDMMKDERRWIEQLARELARVLQGASGSSTREARGLMKDRGIIALDEVWGGWNRARGVALLPPATLLQVVPHLPTCTNPTIRMRTFASGLSVLHTPPYTQAAFAARLSGLLTLAGPKTALEIANEERLTVSLATEMIGAVEAEGDICRDDGACMIRGGGGTSAEVRWWGNVFHGYVWDGHVQTENDIEY